MLIKWIFRGVWILLLVSLCARGEVPDLLLLKRYQPGMPIQGWLMSEKLDGVRAYWDGHQLMTRQGNRLAAPDWFTEKLPAFELDGELWMGRGRFEQTLSIVSRNQPGRGWEQVGYHIFEVPHAPGDLQARLSKLRDYLSSTPVSHLHVIPQTVCHDSAHLFKTLEQVEALGAEGLVLRNPVTPYQTGRSENALKVKRFDDMEGRVIGYSAGKGKYKGKTGALWVEIANGVRFYIGSGLSDKERDSPPPTGSLITFRYQGFTSNGIPRFASFIRIRELSTEIRSK